MTKKPASMSIGVGPTTTTIGKIKEANPCIITLRIGNINTTIIITILRHRRHHHTAIHMIITITHITTTTPHHLCRRLMQGGILVRLDQQQQLPFP
jgi:hypothetical protein